MPGFNPTSINVDFEQSAIISGMLKISRYTFHSLTSHFSINSLDAPNSKDSKIAGCFFHLLKNFKKQLGNAGLMQKYRIRRLILHSLQEC
uniref:Uncharacterized protein n=1 Tax=Ditylenchus dipsaci TaxID=166011 RepID=A0A915DKD0_9BILA